MPSGSETRSARAVNTLEAVRSALRSVEAQIETLDLENNDLRRDCEGSNVLNGHLESERQTLQIELEQALVSNDHLRQQLADLKRQLGEAQHENARLNGEVARMAAEAESAQHRNAALRAEVVGLHREACVDDWPTLVLQLATRLTGAEVGLFTNSVEKSASADAAAPGSEEDAEDTLAAVGIEELPELLASSLHHYSRQVAYSGRPLIENDAQALPDDTGLVNLAVLPLAIKNEAHGVVLLANKRSGPFTEEDTELLLAIGQHAGVALENARLHSELGRAYAGTVAVLADAIEAKDAYTRGHCEDVARVAVEVARRLGVEETQLEQVRYAALLHDVGKIGIPDGILLKPGKLLPEEFTIIQRHTQIGYDLVTRVPTLEELGPVILHHHERWDGAGYPDRLMGEEIPLLSRVIGAVDALDAMTTLRPYRDAMPIVEAINELERCAGTQFDPDVVKTLVQVVGELQVFVTPVEARSAQARNERG